jgi:hypothetical protein
MAAVLWCGGEDIDFTVGGTPASMGTSSTFFRSSYARGYLFTPASVISAQSCRSLAFSGGAVTSFWLHFQNYFIDPSTSFLFLGLSQTANGTASGLYVGSDSGTTLKVALWTLDGTTFTKLASESGSSLTGAALQTIDMQVINFGASATVNIYVNSVLTITYSGATTITGVSNLDCVSVPGPGSVGGGHPQTFVSEIIVTDTIDTRAMSLMTMAPNAAGDNNNWASGTFASINPVTINDANNIDTNATGQDFQANVTDLPSGTFSVQAVKVAARAQVQAGATPTGIKLGVRESATNYLDGGRSLTNTWATYERLMTTNPATSAAWAQSVMNALQLELQSQ